MQQAQLLKNEYDPERSTLPGDTDVSLRSYVIIVKDWLARNQIKVSEWSGVGLVQNRHHRYLLIKI